MEGEDIIGRLEFGDCDKTNLKRRPQRKEGVCQLEGREVRCVEMR